MKELLNEIATQQSLMFYILLIISILLTRIPIIGKYFRSVNTLIHEAGHALTTLLVSGEIISVNLFADTSGTTVTKAKNRFFQVLIAVSGYPASSITGLLCMFLLYKGFHVSILFILVSIALLLMVLSIRNAYGLFWSGTFSLLILLLIYFNHPLALQLSAAFFSLIILSDSVISCLVLFVLSIRNPNKAGDATNLQKFTRIPAVIWAFIFLVVSLIIAYLAATRYFPSFKSLFSSF